MVMMIWQLNYKIVPLFVTAVVYNAHDDNYDNNDEDSSSNTSTYNCWNTHIDKYIVLALLGNKRPTATQL